MFWLAKFLCDCSLHKNCYLLNLYMHQSATAIHPGMLMKWWPNKDKCDSVPCKWVPLCADWLSGFRKEKGGRNGGKLNINSSLIKGTVIQSLIFLTLPLIIGGIRKRTIYSWDWFLFFINLNLHIRDKQKFFSVAGWIMPYKILIPTEEVVINKLHLKI